MSLSVQKAEQIARSLNHSCVTYLAQCPEELRAVMIASIPPPGNSEAA